MYSRLNRSRARATPPANARRARSILSSSPFTAPSGTWHRARGLPLTRARRPSGLDDVPPSHDALSRRQLALVLTSITWASSVSCPAFGMDALSSPDSSTYVSNTQGFTLSYPSSFVVAFDRTASYPPQNIPFDEDVALTSFGSYKKSFLTVTVFAKRVSGPQSAPRQVGTEFFYDNVIRPVVDAPTTIGFSLQDEAYIAGNGCETSSYDFEFMHSVCRGETIEGKAGALRCIGNFGQDLPVQRRIVLGRSILREDVLLTVMGSIRTEGGDIADGMAEERRVVQGITQSFRPYEVRHDGPL